MRDLFFFMNRISLTLNSALIMTEDIPRAPESLEDCRRLCRKFEASLNLTLGVILARGVGGITGSYHDYESKKKTKNLMVNLLDFTSLRLRLFSHFDSFDFFPTLIPSIFSHFDSFNFFPTLIPSTFFHFYSFVGRKNGIKKLDLFYSLCRTPYPSPTSAQT